MTVDFQNVTKDYGNVKALDNISFQIIPGKVVGLIGPNGSGKTTLMKSLCGLTPFNGHVSVFDIESKYNRHKVLKKISYIPDSSCLPEWMKIYQVIETYQNLHSQFDIDKAKSLFHKNNLEINRKIGELSKGQKTMVHLICAISVDVPLLVLDEPTLGLDIMKRESINRLLIEDYLDETRTILISSHIIQEIEPILTDIMIIHEGKIRCYCPLELLSDQYFILKTPKQTELMDKIEKFQPLTEFHGLDSVRYLFSTNILSKTKAKELGQIETISLNDVYKFYCQGDIK